MKPYSRITGTGSYLPPRRVSNAELVAELALRGVETSDQWIVERTGIRARHFAAADVAASDLAAHAARAVLAKADRTEADIDWLIPHQANLRIMQSTAKKLKLPLDKLVVTVDQHGNTSAASIPLALDAWVRQGKIGNGDTLMLEGVGGGFTWGAVLLEF